MKTTEISWGSKIDPSEITYIPGNETIPKTKYGIITDQHNDNYLVVNEFIREGDKYYHFVDGDGLIYTAPNCTITLSHLNSFLDVKKLIKWI